MIWTWRIFMFLKTFITLTICVALQSCSTTTPFPSKNNDQSNCAPKATFNPSKVNVSSSGVFAFLSKKQNFNYDFINYKWICKKPIAPIVARFEQPDAKLLLKSIISKKNNASEVITKNIELAQKTQFHSYVTKQCDQLGLSYLFELEAGLNKKIIGCQINASANSAIMWKKMNNERLAQVAYLPIYQPFVTQIFNSIEQKD